MSVRSVKLTVRRLVPPRVRGILKRVPRALDPLAIRLYRGRTGDQRPVPPKLLRERTGAPNIASHFEIGDRCARSLDRALRTIGTTMSDYEAILDFGCGAGKVLQGYYHEHGARLAGCDIHEPSVRWLQQNFPKATFATNDFAPPLPFPDASFDLIYALSVFTHLDEATQDLWIDELKRVARPGAILLLTVHGEAALRRDWSGPGLTKAASDRLHRVASLDEEGFFFQPYDDLGSDPKSYCGTAEVYGLAFHSRDYLAAHWGLKLELVAMLPAAVLALQDIVILRKADELPRDRALPANPG